MQVQDVANKPFAVITYTEAVERLEKSGAKFEYPVCWGADLQSEHERYLTEKDFGGTPLFVTDYPKGIKVGFHRATGVCWGCRALQAYPLLFNRQWHFVAVMDLGWTSRAFVPRPQNALQAFYMRANDDGKTVAAMDLLVPRVGELIGGSQREERLEVLFLEWFVDFVAKDGGERDPTARQCW